MKRVGVLFTHGPWRGVDAAAGIDTALALLAFEHELHVAFVGAGVEMLVVDDAGGVRAHCRRMLSALRHHGAASLVASSDCLEKRGLDPQLDDIETKPLAEIAARLHGNDHVITF